MHGNEQDVTSVRSCQRCKMFRVGGDDLIPVKSHRNECGIDDVALAGCRQEETRASRQLLVQAEHFNRAQRLAEPRLSPPASPDLAQDPGVRQRRSATAVGDRQSFPHGAVVSFQCNERATIEELTHVAYVTPRPYPRTRD